MKQIEQLETPRNITLKRQALKNIHSQRRLPHQDSINTIARIRLLEDDYYAQKYKNQALQKNMKQYLNTIQTLQFSIKELKEQLRHTHTQAKDIVEKDKQLRIYQVSFQELSQEILSINNILLKKKQQQQALLLQNENLQLKVKQFLNHLSLSRQRQENYQNQLSSILQSLQIHQQPFLTPQKTILNYIECIKEGIYGLKETSLKNKQLIQIQRKRNADELIQAKQTIIKLQYALKLQQQRANDKAKQNRLESEHLADKNMERILEEMIEKEDELNYKIQSLKNENEDLHEQHQIQLQSAKHHYQIKLAQIEGELKRAQSRFQQLAKQKQIVESQYIKITQNHQPELSKKYREIIDENRLLQLRVQELESSNKMLTKQLQLRDKS